MEKMQFLRATSCEEMNGVGGWGVGGLERREFRTSRMELICLGFRGRVILPESIFMLACEGNRDQGKFER